MSVPGDYDCAHRLGFYATSPTASPFWIGCLIYAIVGAIAAIICCFAFGSKNRGVAVHSAIIGTVCLWIMWAMTWLSQWHPLTYPQYTPEMFNGTEYNGTYASCNATTTTVETIYWLGDDTELTASE
mmetsp:Transcript_68568/g.61602  ORF Transcript_68568/g.61602 Transcript_68568/m.61602 type:complete len:127 (-) Transcript_68568:374-754(-)|eukprot:CAMPEP_0201568198 /NCGR_PEP_ID=MMETSP0190_2-20130828/9150_1 /ASSEMBLY_ACC=CAM_ASM_000263 /TAXON_ID=37353 /ORGANISM="Rosalina sp." /LENGTH=126 /DNA_ID=CAMNT_0047989057 /DNA_START=84 /DNA_END=464 /DNA_ORIENTATION=-